MDKKGKVILGTILFMVLILAGFIFGAQSSQGQLSFSQTEETASECDVFPREGGESGEETCLNNGYNSCLLGEYHRTISYLDGLDACEGEVQVEIEQSYLGECPANGGGGGGGCGFNSEGVEPYYGSFSTSTPGEINVVCCR